MKNILNRININRNIISLIAIIILGITFIVSGTGKLLGLEEVPSQITDFINAIIPSFMLTPGMIYFLYHILIPHLFPWAELILGLFILIGFVPRLIAILYLPLLLSFLGTNIWSITKGGYSTCADCFGIWEQVFGALTPVQSLIYDIVLMCCALAIIVLYPAGFLSSRKWLSEFIKNSGTAIKSIRDGIMDFANIRNLIDRTFRQNPRKVLFFGLSIICVVLIIYGVVVVVNSARILRTESENTAAQVSNLSVSNITANSALISWSTDEYTITSVQLCDAESTRIHVYTDPAENTLHRITIDNLSPNTTYYFQILTNGIPKYDEIIATTYFETLHADTGKPVITNVNTHYMSDRDVTITWSTNKPATSEIEYWIADSSSRCQEADDSLTTTHSILLTMLYPDTIYNYIVKFI